MKMLHIKKFKKCFTALLASCLLLTGAPASLAEETQPVSLEELEDLSAEMLAKAQTEEVLSPVSETEDGYAFAYDFGTLYADTAELGADTDLNGFTVMDEEIQALRGTSINLSTEELIASMPGENASLSGTYEAALLYLEGSPEEGFSFGLVLRDGQRLGSVEYAQALPQANGVSLAGIIYAMEGDGVASIQVYGLSDSNLLDATEARELYNWLGTLKEETEYERVQVSFNGSELTKFAEEDLSFLALDYLQAQPEDMPGKLEDMLLEDGEDWLRIVVGEGYEAVFRCDAEGKNASLVSCSLLSDELEGPRGVRLGDSFSDVFNRFRHGDGEYDDANMTEVLYTSEDGISEGVAYYNDGDGMTLRYTTALSDGRSVMLYLHFVETELTEIILQTL